MLGHLASLSFHFLIYRIEIFLKKPIFIECLPWISTFHELVDDFLGYPHLIAIFISIPIIQKRHRRWLCPSSQSLTGGLRTSNPGCLTPKPVLSHIPLIAPTTEELSEIIYTEYSAQCLLLGPRKTEFSLGN